MGFDNARRRATRSEIEGYLASLVTQPDCGDSVIDEPFRERDLYTTDGEAPVDPPGGR
jgi:hypothetical protein